MVTTRSARKREEKESAVAAESAPRSYRSAIVLFFILPWIALTGVQGIDTVKNALSAELRPDLFSASFSLVDPLLLVALSTPHIFYFFLWTNSKAFYDFVKPIGEPFEVFALCAHFIKALQASCFLVWYFRTSVHFLIKDPSSTTGVYLNTEEIVNHVKTLATVESLEAFLFSFSLARALLVFQCVAVGQLLNAAVYGAIGEAGVYYGTRLGKDIPWVVGFPFDVVPHAQYFGATLSIWGLCAAAANPDTLSRGLWAIPVAMTAFYAFSSYVEQEL